MDTRLIDYQLTQVALDTLHGSLAILDDTGKIVVANQTWKRVAATDAVPLLRGSDVGTNLLAHWMQTPRSPFTRADLQTIAEVIEGKDQTFRKEYQLARGALTDDRWIQLTVTRLDQTTGGAIVTQIDISQHMQERAQAQGETNQHGSLVPSDLEVTAIVSSSFEIVYITPSVIHAHGYTAEEFQAEWPHNIHPDDAVYAYQVFSSAIQAPTPPKTIKMRFRHRDETYHTHSVVVASIHTESESFLIATAHDITLLSRIHEEFHFQ